MEVELDVISADGEAEGELWRWLNDVGELRGRTRLVGVPRSGLEAAGQAMGTSATDVIAVAVGAGGAMSVLAQSLTVWLRQPRGLAIRLKITRPDGIVTELSVDRAVDAASAEALVRSALGLSEPKN